MKKGRKVFLTAVLCAVLIALPFAVGSFAAGSGDINGDGEITLADAMSVFEYISGNIEYSEEQRRTADVDGSGDITLADAMTIFARVAGTETGGSGNNSFSLLVGTYNIKSGDLVKNDFTVLGADVLAKRLDICGFQEVDRFTNRNGKQDTLKIIGSEAGLAYCHYSGAISYDGGKYGIGMCSRYHISDYTTTRLPSGNYENRVYSIGTVSVSGRKIYVLNVHLTYEDKAVRQTQLAAVAKVVNALDAPYMIFGDFNTGDFSELSVFKNAKLVNSPASTFLTFYSTAMPIDNIVLSKEWTVSASGMYKVKHSDHYMLYATITLMG